jgi:hypothetical protein
MDEWKVATLRRRDTRGLEKPYYHVRLGLGTSFHFKRTERKISHKNDQIITKVKEWVQSSGLG